jgi:hypothetical protein
MENYRFQFTASLYFGQTWKIFLPLLLATLTAWCGVNASIYYNLQHQPNESLKQVCLLIFHIQIQDNFFNSEIKEKTTSSIWVNVEFINKIKLNTFYLDYVHW